MWYSIGDIYITTIDWLIIKTDENNEWDGLCPGACEWIEAQRFVETINYFQKIAWQQKKFDDNGKRTKILKECVGCASVCVCESMTELRH